MSSNLSSSAIFNPRNPRLAGVYGKMNRAVEHVKQLDEWYDAWIETNPWSVETETDANGIAKRQYFRITNPVPVFVGLVVGDAIHNIRCALDHLAGAVAIKNGKTTKGVYFPIVRQSGDLAGAIKDKLRKCPKAFGDFVEHLKPYESGNADLYALHQLDILDKHQILVPIGAGSSIRINAPQGLFGAIDFSKVDRPVNIPLKSGRTLIEDGDTIVEFTSPPWWLPKETTIDTEVAISIVFGEDSPIPGKEVRSTLHSLIKAVENVIIAAEVKFLK